MAKIDWRRKPRIKEPEKDWLAKRAEWALRDWERKLSPSDLKKLSAPDTDLKPESNKPGNAVPCDPGRQTGHPPGRLKV